MTSKAARAIDLELIERVHDHQYDDHVESGTPVVPNHYRINGQGVLIPIGTEIEIDRLDASYPVVIARMSMYVSTLTVGIERRGETSSLDERWTTDLLPQVQAGRAVTIGDGTSIDPNATPLWSGAAYDQVDLTRLRDEINALLEP